MALLLNSYLQARRLQARVPTLAVFRRQVVSPIPGWTVRRKTLTHLGPDAGLDEVNHGLRKGSHREHSIDAKASQRLYILLRYCATHQQQHLTQKAPVLDRKSVV